MEPLLPTGDNRCGRWRDRCPVINGIIQRLGTGCQWREPPERFGPWQPSTNATCCGRPTTPGRSCSNTSRPSPTPRATSTGIPTSTPPQSAPISTPPGRRRTRRRQRPVLQGRFDLGLG
ncbi:transposase [Streptomyces sp. NPDC058632]|uniref:transposase n=1 Tax=unclassified Streptomyces TaxID=2593676 RepID=UPI0036657E8C